MSLVDDALLRTGCNHATSLHSNRALGRLFVPTKKTTAHRSPWSKEDVKELKAHSKARTPVAKIAKAMKRTEGALRRKAGILGIGLGHDR